MEIEFNWGTLVVLCFSGILCFLLHYLYGFLWLKPERMREKLRKQGMRGPPPSLLFGNITEMKKIQMEEKGLIGSSANVMVDYSVALFPYFKKWRNEFGPLFMYSTGSIQLLYVSDPDLIKEIGLYKPLDIGKPVYLTKERGALFGNGILTSNGEVWTHQRKVIAPEFYADKVKGMVDLILDAAVPLLKSWDTIVESGGGIGLITVGEDLRSFSADVISRASFGSNYLEGKEMFLKLRQLQNLMSKTNLLIGIPGLRYLPTKANREIWRLNREIRTLILKLVEERREGSQASPKKDLLQSILDGAKDNLVSTKDHDNFIVDNCKNIFFAGHETAATSASWCLMLLASHPKWQAQARAEVIEVCQGGPPNADMLRKMKTLTMVIQESLRLYPPTAFVTREAFKDIKLGKLNIPKGITMVIPTSILHHEQEIWGPDADEFKPERFTNGISGACKFPHAYIPFGLGARTCLGQNLAMVELKIILSLILLKFSFSLSPSYVHAPAFRLTIEPEFGVPLSVNKV
ncbi:Unspecific monooxygenase protein [Dioscorea alata]|uniref:Unspecific monooxygenase protein n=1 Tax=Dioscorea alata TaxID=55571 RepID=A0ACB7VEY5_DIOAL|nr:Unspecific monooxygenase protein [Dioscorea alata]